MTQIFSGNVFNISSSSCIWAIIQYDKKRDGANMLYRFNYKLYLAKNDGTGTPVPSTWSTNYSNNLKTVFTLNGTNVWTQNSQSNNQRWSFEYTTDWFTISNKTSGTTPFKFTIKDTQNSNWCNYTSGTYSLEVDPAGSKFGAIAHFNIGTSFTVPVTKYATMYDVVTIKIGSTTIKTINDASTNNSIIFSSSELDAIYGLTTEDQEKEFTFELKSYSDSTKATLVGEDSKTAKGYIVGSYPIINSITAVDINSTTVALTGANTKIVKNVSNAKVSVSISAVNNATIKSVTINDKTATLNDGYYVATFNSVTTNSFDVKVVDSRGFPTNKNLTISNSNYIQYVDLTLSANVYRNQPTDGKVVIDYSGKYYNGSFGSINNTLEVSYRYKEKGGSFSEWISLSPIKSSNTYYQTTTIEGFDYKKQYVFEVKAVDKLNIRPVTDINVSKGEPILYWKEELAGVNGDFIVKSDKSIKSGRYIESDHIETFQSGLFGSNNNGYRFKAIRSAISGNSDYPQYASGMAWTGNDTHGFILTKYNSADVVIGGGNSDAIKWVKHLAFKDDLVAYITESGTNSNGKYIKFSNGMMLCFGTFTVETAINTAFGSDYSVDLTNVLTFPSTFVAINSVNVSNVGQYSAYIHRLNYSSSGITFLGLSRPSALTSQTYRLSYEAWGTWK